MGCRCFTDAASCEPLLGGVWGSGYEPADMGSAASVWCVMNMPRTVFPTASIPVLHALLCVCCVMHVNQTASFGAVMSCLVLFCRLLMTSLCAASCCGCSLTTATLWLHNRQLQPWHSDTSIYLGPYQARWN